MSFDIDCLDAEGATGSYDSAFHNKSATICDAVINQGYEFGFVHVKAVDDTGHDRRLQHKVRNNCICNCMPFTGLGIYLLYCLHIWQDIGGKVMSLRALQLLGFNYIIYRTRKGGTGLSMAHTPAEAQRVQRVNTMLLTGALSRSCGQDGWPNHQTALGGRKRW